MNRFTLSFLLTTLLTLPLLASAAELQLGVGDFGTGTGTRNVYIEGQQAQLSIRVIRGGGEKYLGLPSGAPYGLKIQAGTRTAVGFIENPAWTRQLSLIHYVDRYRVHADSLYRFKSTPVGLDGDESDLGEFYQFCFTMPESPTDRRVCLRVVYEHPEFGHLETDPQCITVVSSQTEDAERLIWSSLINAAYARNDVPRVIALADSFIALGFVDPDWTDMAKTVAYDNGQYNKALEYLDLNFEVNGVTTRSDIHEWDGQRLLITDRRQQNYDRQRKDFLSRIGGK
jgi:hypothetical protein